MHRISNACTGRNGGENQTTLGSYTGIHSPLPWSISNLLYSPKLDAFHIHRQAPRLGAFPPCSTLETCTKLIQDLCNSSRPPTANNRISGPILRPESARKHAPAAPPLPPLLGRFFAQSDASLVMHCFRTVFRPISLWSGPQFPVMHHFLGKCNAFAALSRPPPQCRKTVPQPLK